MAGHSKWANIKHKKGKQDELRQRLFQKLAKKISLAIKLGNSNDPSINSKLRNAIDEAKSNNMPNSNIEKLLSTKKDASKVQEISYEGYGPSGVAILIKCVTDNINRTASFVKSTLTKNGGNLGSNGSVSFLFKRKGIIVLDNEKYKIDDKFIEEKLFNLDLIDVEKDEFVTTLEVDTNLIYKVRDELKEMGIDEFEEFSINLVPDTFVDLDSETYQKIETLINKLEESDDILEAFSNASLKTR